MGAEQVHTLGAFEDGRDLSGAGGGLDGQDRPQACLFCRPIDLPHCPFYAFMTYQFNCLPFRLSSVLGPNFTKICCSLAETTRLLDDKLHQQQPTHGQHKGGSQADGRACSDSTGTTWFHSKLCQVLTRSVQ